MGKGLQPHHVPAGLEEIDFDDGGKSANGLDPHSLEAGLKALQVLFATNSACLLAMPNGYHVFYFTSPRMRVHFLLLLISCLQRQKR